ncbi:hypothetical protein [Haladaptatus sp. DFWS20]|uniref:hypothetical protein n=1 Tax=Haladaptatus sp. DFWS20 TaxID=3403467 RepID=UPI003EBD48AE
MNRRTFLGSIGILGASGIAGYSFLRRRFSSYPNLPDNATSLSYTVHRRVDNGVLLKGDFSSGLALVTDAAGLDQFRTDWQTAEDKAFFEATDFSASFLLGPQIITSGDSTGIDIVDVVQTPDGAVHSYSYVENPSMQDDAFLRGFVVRVERTGTPPTEAHHMHRGGNTDIDVTATPAGQAEE